MVQAGQLKAGDCLRTVEGPRRVESVARQVGPEKELETPGVHSAQDGNAAHTEDKDAVPMIFTVVLDGATDLLAVGGVFTHARPSEDAKTRKAALSTFLRGAKNSIAKLNLELGIAA